MVDALDRSEWTPLMRAAALGKSARAIEILINKGAEVNACNDYGRTALIEAASRGDVPVMEVLLKNGADTNIVPHKVGGPAVVEAAYNNRPLAVILLVRSGADADPRGKREKTALTYMADRGHVDAVKALMDAGADIHALSYYKTTPLMEAAGGGHLDVVRLLLDAGAKINAVDPHGKTALLYAAGYYKDSPELVRYLLSRKANPLATDKDGRNALEFAAMAKNPGVLEVLEQHDRKIGRAPSREKRSKALLSASIGHDLATMRKILDMGYVDVDYQSDHTGCTPLMTAAASGREDLVDLLCEHGADIRIRDEKGWDAFFHAAESFHVSVMEKLLALGSDLHGKGTMGESVFMVVTASWKKDYLRKTDDTLQWLVSKGLDCNESDKIGNTALMVAVEKKKAGTVKFLIENGADVNARNNKGETALITAASFGWMDDRFFPKEPAKNDAMLPILEMLLDAGADPCIFSKEHRPLVEAARLRSFDAVKRLTDTGVNDAETLNRALLACAREAPRIARYLIKHGADVQTRGYQGRTPLMAVAASWRVTTKTLNVLLSKKAPIDAVDDYGQTALMHAARTHTVENVKFLLENGADPLVKDNRGRTALDHAREGYGEDSVKVISEAMNT